VSLGEIACAEPLSIGLHAVHRAGELLGKTVLVTGGGTIGCMCVLAARLAGAAEVIVCDIADRPLAMAAGGRRPHHPLRPGRAALADIADIASRPPAAPPHWRTCLATRRGGRIVQVGTLPAEACRSRPTA
jgi:L-idonate 5-dehydrogenase